MLSITTISFDLFVYEALISLQKGVKLIIANEKYADEMQKEAVVKYGFDRNYCVDILKMISLYKAEWLRGLGRCT